MKILFYQNDCFFPIPTRGKQTQCSVVNALPFDVAKNFSTSCCLVFADPNHIGGGFHAVMDFPLLVSQEEDLFRKSNLPEILYLNKEVRAFYPLTDLKGIYCDGVRVKRDSQLQPITPYETSAIMMPAEVYPPTSQDYNLAYLKILRIFQIAQDNWVENLILGAWGCGVFMNDPTTIARLFKNAIIKYSGVFSNIVFAIPQNNESSLNFQIFSKEVL